MEATFGVMTGSSENTEFLIVSSCISRIRLVLVGMGASAFLMQEAKLAAVCAKVKLSSRV